ncbi:MAG: hypothetical protein ACYTGZ_15465 [Planctomycetota bacterium]|jgi:hypothetical protein
MRKISMLLFAAFLTACGSGGGDGDTTTSEVNAADQQRAQAMLDSCAGEGIAGLLAITSLTPGAGADIELLPYPGGAIPYMADLDGDTEPDLMGAISFRDETGAPYDPFTPEQLEGGIDALIALLPTLANGTTMVIDAAPSVELGFDQALLSILFQGGLPISVDGQVRGVVDTCSVSLRFEEVSVLALIGATPNLTADLIIEDGIDALEGTVAFHGGDSGTIEVALNGGAPLEFTYDIESGTLTPAVAG